MTREDHPGGAIAMKLLQGYVWQPRAKPELSLPDSLPMGATVVMDRIPAPMAFFDNGTPTETQSFYQLTVFEIFPDWVENEVMASRAMLASDELNLILNATDPNVGWSLSEDLRPA
jgi:hypothetical protein